MTTSGGARYRTVYFTPDPFSGGRFPIAALVRLTDRIVAVRASRLPDANAVGSAANFSVMNAILAMLDGPLADFELPGSVGALAYLEVERRVPIDTFDPVRWVEQLLPCPIRQETR